jgi:hypothetical protein
MFKTLYMPHACNTAIRSRPGPGNFKDSPRQRLKTGPHKLLPFIFRHVGKTTLNISLRDAAPALHRQAEQNGQRPG